MTFEYVRWVPLLFTTVPQAFEVGILNLTDEPVNAGLHPADESARTLCEYVISKFTNAHKGMFTIIPHSVQVTVSSVKLSDPSHCPSFIFEVVVVTKVNITSKFISLGYEPTICASVISILFVKRKNVRLLLLFVTRCFEV